MFAWDLGGMELNEENLRLLKQTFYSGKFRKNEEDNAFTLELLNNIKDNMEFIDKQIDEHSKNWKIYRMDKVDLALLRLGTSEILYSDLSPAIIINEEVKISRNYGSERSSNFVNVLLNAIADNNGKK